MAPRSQPSVERFERSGGTLVAEVLTDPSVGSSSIRPDPPDVPDRPDLVFLHGWGGSRESLRGIGVLFQHMARVHLLDLPGFGDAPIAPREWGTTQYADLVQEYLTERVPGQAILVGHSFGGRVSLRLGARRLPQIRALVLMGTPGLPSSGLSKQRIRRWGIRRLRTILQATKGITGPGPLEWHTKKFGSKDYLAAGELRQLLVKTVNEDLTDSATAITCPTLLIWGTDDTETPPSLAFRYRDLMHGRASIAMLPHKDHHLYTGTGSHLCAFKIRQWLGQVGQVGQVGRVGTESTK